MTAVLTPGTVGSATAVSNHHIVEPEIERQAWQCRRIINRHTLESYERSLDPSCKWSMLYKYASLKPLEFECEMDAVGAEAPVNTFVTAIGQPRYDKSDLEEMNVPRLRAVAAPYGVTGRSKSEIVMAILKAQDAPVR